MSLLAKRLHMNSEYDCVTFGVGELLSQLLFLAGPELLLSGFPHRWVYNSPPSLDSS